MLSTAFTSFISLKNRRHVSFANNYINYHSSIRMNNGCTSYLKYFATELNIAAALAMRNCFLENLYILLCIYHNRNVQYY